MTQAPDLQKENLERKVVEAVTFAAFEDYGVNNANQAAVANLVNSLAPDLIITTGDNSYGRDSIDENVGKYFSKYIGSYQGTYGTGSSINRFFPSLGNHVDNISGTGSVPEGGLSTYLSYFDLPGEGVTSSLTSGNEHYYDFVQDLVHFFALDSNTSIGDQGIVPGDGLSPSSPQGLWLQDQLANAAALWKIVYFHHPPFSTASKHASTLDMQWPFEDWGMTAILSGHDHTYERIIRDDNGDKIPLPYFVTGLGGAGIYDFSESVVAGSKALYNETHGTMFIEANITAVSFHLYAITGELIDTYTISAEPTGSISGFFGDDTNANKLKDSDEDGIANIDISLLDTTGKKIATETTGSDGFYLFRNLQPSNYTLQTDSSILPLGAVQTADPDGGYGNQAEVVLEQGQVILDQDFGHQVPAIFETRISSSSDDAEEHASGRMLLTSTDLELTFDRNSEQVVGMRFSGVDIPQGATITNAYIQFQTDESSTEVTNLRLRGEATNNALAFTNAAGNISTRSLTDAEVFWNPSPWQVKGEADLAQQTPDIAEIIQEIVSRSEWDPGNALAIVVEGNGERVAESFDGLPASAPLLHVSYTSSAFDTSQHEYQFTQTFLNPLPESGDLFAGNVAISGQHVLVSSVVGDDDFDSGNINNDVAYLFDVLTGELKHTLNNPSPPPNNPFSASFGATVALDANYAVVGAPLADEDGENTGAAYLFDAETGALLQHFLSPNPRDDEQFGGAISISGNRVLIGAPGNDVSSPNGGAAYLFDTVTGKPLQSFSNPTPDGGDFFGEAVAISGNYALIGAPLDDEGARNSGVVHLFDTMTGELLQTFLNPTPYRSDLFGRDIAIDGDLVAIGAPFDDSGANNSGVVYLFDAQTGEELQTLMNPILSSDDFFGISVAVDSSQETILVGASGANDSVDNSGIAYLFDVTTGQLIQTLMNPTSSEGDLFGGSVDLDGPNLVIGAVGDDNGGLNSGAAHLFGQLSESLPNNQFPNQLKLSPALSL